MERPVRPLQCPAVGHGRGAGQHGHCTQHPKAGTQFSIRQPHRAAGYGQQQKGIQQHKQQQPARHTGPRIQHILFNMHRPQRKDTAIIMGHQPDRFTVVADIQRQGVLLLFHIDAGLFPGNGTRIIRSKIHAGAALDTALPHAGHIAVIQRHLIVPFGQGHGWGLEDVLAIGHFGNADAAVLVITDF